MLFIHKHRCSLSTSAFLSSIVHSSEENAGQSLRQHLEVQVTEMCNQEPFLNISFEKPRASCSPQLHNDRTLDIRTWIPPHLHTPSAIRCLTQNRQPVFHLHLKPAQMSL